MATKLLKSTAGKAKAKTPRATVGKTSATTEDRRAIAMQMLLAGHNCPDIGKALGISRQGAWGLAREAMAELKAETLEDAATWRALLTQAYRLW